MPRLFRWLLSVLPRDFRREFGREMGETVDEHWSAVRGRGPWPAVRFWARQAVAVLRIAVRLRMEGGRAALPGRGGAYGDDRERSGAMEGTGRDVRHALRAFARRPGFTAVAVLTLGLGIGATTSIFSAVHSVLFRDLPYGDAERIVVVRQASLADGPPSDGVSAANARDLGAAAELLSTVAHAEPWSLDLVVEGRAETLRTWIVSRGFFEALGTDAALGRTFTEDEYVDGNDAVVLLSDRTWRNRFGADPGVVGSTVQLDGSPRTVVGVLPPAFKFPDAAELWAPRPPQARDDTGRGADFLTGVARLAPAASVARAQAEADRVAASLAEAHPATNDGIGFRLVPLREHLFGDVRTALWLIFGAVGCVLLIACANVAGLMLARGEQRRREYALRGALGASVGRLVRQVAVEASLLAVVGCALGVLLAFAGVGLIQGLGPDHLPRIDELTIDRTVLAFAVVVSGLAALLSALAPSLRLSRPDIAATLADGSRGTGTGRRSHRLRDRVVVAEVALAVVLLVGAGLLFRSFARVLDEELGFEPEGRLAVQVFAYGYPDAAARADFVRRSLEGIEAIPGVEAVALSTNVPGATDDAIASIDIDVPFVVHDRAAPPAGQEPIASVSMVSAGFFDVLGIPVVAGRGFGAGDEPSAPPVIVVNEALARRHFPGEDPVGRSLVVTFGRPVPREIVGVAADVRPLGYESEPRPEVYFPLTQVGSGSLTFVVRARGDAAALTAPVTEAIWAVNPSQAVWGAATLETLLSDWLVERRFNLTLLGGFAAVALLLAAIGIYGLISFSVEQRVGELGIRRALGGTGPTLLAMVMRQGAVLAATGIVLGLLGAAALTRFLRGMLFGVEALDPATFGGLAAVVLVVSALATWLPARRATRIDPMVALRGE